MLSSFCAERLAERRDNATSSASCRSVLRPPLCVLPRTSQKAQGSCSRIVISGARTALSPWLWARIDFVDGASSLSSLPRSLPLHNGGWCTHYCDCRGNDPLSKPCSVYRECERKREFVVGEAGGRNFRLGIIRSLSPLWRISRWFISRDSRVVSLTLPFFLSFFSGTKGERARRVAFLLGC